jgi:predicted dehydrogenase
VSAPANPTEREEPVVAPQQIHLVGCGAIARQHIDHARRHAWGQHLSWHASDRDPQVRERFAQDHPDVVVHDDVERMLATPATPRDIAIVCTPPASHREVALAAFASRRHVLCEKPLARDLAEAREMLAAARANRRLLACCSNRFLGAPVIERARAWVTRSGEQPLRVRWIERHNRARSGIEYQPASTWFLDRSISGGGVTMDWGPYDLAVLDHLLEPDEIRVDACAMSRAQTAVALPAGTVFDVETAVSATLRYTLPDGRRVPVVIDRASATNGTPQRLFEIEGTREAIDLEWIRRPRFAVHGDREGAFVTTEEQVATNPMDVHARPLHEMLRAVDGASSLSLLDDRALFNQAVIDALYGVAASGRPATVRRSELA